MMRKFSIKVAFCWLLLAAAVSAGGCSRGWSESSRTSAGLAPDPASEQRAVVQAYAAAVWGWRGFFADHTWLAVKEAQADYYTIYEVRGWYLRRGGNSAVHIARDVPDRRWYGAEPYLLLDLRGDEAAAAVGKIADAAQRYPYSDQYKAFPGPNSNTFTAWLAQEVPELNLRLPLRAVGKSYPLNL